MDQINHIAGVNGLWVVEDAAEAPFATYKGRPAGSLASIATFSFYGNKVITCGEGGALTLTDARLELRARTLRGQGMDPRRRYYFPVTGYNFRLSNIACAILCAQLERVDSILTRRRKIYSLYRELLGELPGVGLQPTAPWATVLPWLFSITIDPKVSGCTRDDLILNLTEHGIETRPFFIPLHTLPPFREGSSKRGERLPVTEALGERGINLPTYNTMKDSDVERVAAVVQNFIRAQCP
jgi:perosamine synthetase